MAGAKGHIESKASLIEPMSKRRLQTRFFAIIPVSYDVGSYIFIFHNPKS